jgi:hypothetical protein
MMSVADDSENEGGACDGKEKERWGVPVKRDNAGWGRAMDVLTEAASCFAASESDAAAESVEKDVLDKSRWLLCSGGGASRNGDGAWNVLGALSNWEDGSDMIALAAAFCRYFGNADSLESEVGSPALNAGASIAPLALHARGVNAAKDTTTTRDV